MTNHSHRYDDLLAEVIEDKAAGLEVEEMPLWVALYDDLVSEMQARGLDGICTGYVDILGVRIVPVETPDEAALGIGF